MVIEHKTPERGESATLSDPAKMRSAHAALVAATLVAMAAGQSTHCGAGTVAVEVEAGIFGKPLRARKMARSAPSPKLFNVSRPPTWGGDE